MAITANGLTLTGQGAALEWRTPRTLTYINPAPPFGPDASDSNNAMRLTPMPSRR